MASLCKVCGLSKEGREKIQEACLTQEVEKDKVLIQEHVHQKNLYFLCSGTFIIQKELLKDNKDMVEIARLEAGSLVGEMEFLTEEPPTATVIAGEQCRVHILPGEKFQEMLNGGNSAALELYSLIARVLAYRLQKMDEKVVEILSKEGPSRPMEEFAQFRKKLLKEWNF